MAQICLITLCIMVVSCSADFFLSNKQDPQLGSLLLSLSRLPSQQDNSSPAPRSTSPSSAGSTITSSSNGKPVPIGFIPNNVLNPNSSNTSTNKPSGAPISTASSTNNNCVQRSMRDFRPHATDCSKFTLCMFGRLVDMDCPQGSVYDSKTANCVPRGSSYDLCTTSSRMCPPSFSGRAAHPLHCAQYFQCDRPAQEDRWEEHLQECSYPKLFNTATLRCEHYSVVNCGTREEPRDPCEYRANRCDGHVFCRPCSVRFPSCRGRPDGINPWTGRPGTPDYVVCSGQRVLYHGTCNQTGKGVQIFDEKSGGCVTLNLLP